MKAENQSDANVCSEGRGSGGKGGSGPEVEKRASDLFLKRNQ